MTKYKGFLPLAAIGAILFMNFISSAEALAVMSVDLGSEFMKIAIVKPGVPMEIVLNKESSRKTRTIVAFRDGERHFANQAYSTSVKFPKKAFGYLLNLVGKRFDDPQVEQFRQRFSYHNMIEDEERGTVLFKLEDDTVFSPEELLAMILENAKESVEAFAEQTIKDAVITVPSYFHQAERRAVLSAAEMIGLNVLQLMSDNAAVALNYGVFRRKNFNSTMQYYMFFDMGASSTVVTIVGYHVVKIKEGTRMETNPQLVIKGVGYDRTLGGLEVTLRLRDHLAKLFNDMKKTKTDVRTNNRSMAKLLKEADRVKHILSANADHFAQVEGLLEEKDFKSKITREHLDEMCSDLFDRVKIPVEEALKTSEITMGEISEVILMGGGTRMPKVQEQLIQFTGRKDLGKSINTDEAAALGAVYQAAYLGKGFKVKTFSVKEANLYPIVVEFNKHVSGDDGADTIRTVKRTLFGRMNPFPQKKVMTFNKHFEDFSFGISYGDLDYLSAEEKKVFPSMVLSNVSLEGVKDAHTKHGSEAESKGVKAHFRMDESGILNLDKVESVFEKQETDVNKTEESTWSKLGTAIGGLFGGSKEQDSETVENSDQTDEKKGSKAASGKGDNSTNPIDGNNTTSNNHTGEHSTKPKIEDTSDRPSSNPIDQSETNSNTKPVIDEEQKSESESPKVETKTEEKEEKTDKSKKNSKTTDKDKTSNKKKKDKKKKKDDTDKKADKENKDDTDKKDEKIDKENEKSSSKKNETKTEEPKKPKNVIIKEDIKTSTVNKDLLDVSVDKMAESINRLNELRKKDKQKMELEKAKNNLESYIFDMQDKMSQDEYMKCSREEEQETMSKLFTESSDWLYETAEDTKKQEYKDKLKVLKDGMKDILMRVKEKEERPRALEALRSMLNHSKYFLNTIKNLSQIEDPIFTEIEVIVLEKLVNESTVWRDENVKEQDKLKDNENPKLLVETIAYKIQSLDREVKYLVNKAKTYKPKVKPKITINDTESRPINGTKSKKKKNNSTTIEEPDTTDTPPTQEESPPVTEKSTEETPSSDGVSNPDDTSNQDDTSNTDDTSNQDDTSNPDDTSNSDEKSSDDKESKNKDEKVENEKPIELDDGTHTPRTDL